MKPLLALMTLYAASAMGGDVQFTMRYDGTTAGVLAETGAVSWDLGGDFSDGVFVIQTATDGIHWRPVDGIELYAPDKNRMLVSPGSMVRGELSGSTAPHVTGWITAH